MFINSLSYGTLFGGRWTGTLTFCVDFGGDPSDKAKYELPELIIKIRNSPQNSKLKVVRITGEFGSENEQDVFTFVKALKDSGYFVLALVNGQRHHSWFSLLNYLIVEVGDELWPGFACNELRYRFNSTSSGEEPSCPAEVGARYIIPQEGVSPNKVLDFVHKAKNPWAIISRQKYFMELK